jgi:hypothetical protein
MIVSTWNRTSMATKKMATTAAKATSSPTAEATVRKRSKRTQCANIPLALMIATLPWPYSKPSAEDAAAAAAAVVAADAITEVERG